MDWMAHIAFAFILCALLALRWPVFSGRNIVLVMIGAVLPDIFKLYLPLQLLGIHAQNSLALFHIPVGTLLVCGVCALLFEDGTRVRVFVLFTFGMATHYALDVLLIHVSGGLMLLYPLSWQTWQLHLIRTYDWLGTIILVVAAVILYGVLKLWSDRRVRHVERLQDERSIDVLFYR